MKSITVQELDAKLKSNNPVVVIDVRESWERDIVHINGKHIPMGDIAEHANEIPKDQEVVIHCKSGKRSASVIGFLETQHAFQNLYNLEGGILAWVSEIDTSLEAY